jgi:hypothetical protein
MIYEKRITLPKNTTRAVPVMAEIEIHPGFIRQVEVVFPAGCVGLVGLTLWLWERQLWPVNPDSFFSGDDVHLVIPEDLQIIDPPFVIGVRGWNEDDTFPHRPIVRIQVTPFENDVSTLLANLLNISGGPPISTGD